MLTLRVTQVISHFVPPVTPGQIASISVEADGTIVLLVSNPS